MNGLLWLLSSLLLNPRLWTSPEQAQVPWVATQLIPTEDWSAQPTSSCCLGHRKWRRNQGVDLGCSSTKPSKMEIRSGEKNVSSIQLDLSQDDDVGYLFILNQHYGKLCVRQWARCWQDNGEQDCYVLTIEEGAMLQKATGHIIL